MTPRTCGASTQPAMSSRPSDTSCARVASTGAAVITGEQIRTRRRARAMCFAIRAEAGREPGTHGRSVQAERDRVDEAAAGDLPRRPELLEVRCVAGGDLGR